MVLEMKVPSPGESISEVEIAEWLVKDGDYVEKDQTIAEVDSDKATLDLPAEESGVITLKAQEGDAVAVGAIVCLIDTTAKPPKSSDTKTEVKKEEIRIKPLIGPSSILLALMASGLNGEIIINSKFYRYDLYSNIFLVLCVTFSPKYFTLPYSKSYS